MVSISWTSPKITSKESPVSGKGVFALVDIQAGERVAVLGGYMLSFDDLEALKNTAPSEYDTIVSKGIQVDEDIISSPVDPEQYSDIEYLNHSCDPNLGFRGQLHLVAMRDISAGEELFMDYAMCVTNELFDMTCECGNSNCRGELRSDDWKMPELQTKYSDHFQPYIKRMILRAQ